MFGFALGQATRGTENRDPDTSLFGPSRRNKASRGGDFPVSSSRAIVNYRQATRAAPAGSYDRDARGFKVGRRFLPLRIPPGGIYCKWIHARA